MENIDDKLGVRFTPRETKSKAYCCVYECTSKACRNLDVRFHLFPKINNFVIITNVFGKREYVDCRKMWQTVLKIDKNVTDHMQVCSLHFKKSDYFFPDLRSKKRLKKNSIPSCNLPFTDKIPQLIKNNNNDRETKRTRRDKVRDEVLPANVSNYQEDDLHKPILIKEEPVEQLPDELLIPDVSIKTENFSPVEEIIKDENIKTETEFHSEIIFKQEILDGREVLEHEHT